jgi:hypothetical protein
VTAKPAEPCAERLRLAEHRREQVALSLDTLEDGLHRERSVVEIVRQLIPAQRR